MKKILIVDDNQAQLPLEFLMVVGFSLIITISLVVGLSDSNELNQAMTAYRTGALDGSVSDGQTINDTIEIRVYN